MTEADLLTIKELLLREPLFTGLSEEQIRWVAERFTRVKYAKDAVVFKPNDSGDAFYIVFSGQVSMTAPQKGKVKSSTIFNPGDFFGEEGLLLGQRRGCRVFAVEDTELLRLGRDEFKAVVKEYPKIRSDLMATYRSRMITQKVIKDWIQPGEVVILAVKKHWLFLVRSLVWSVAGLVISLLVLSYATAIYIPWMIGLASFFAAISIILFLWKWIDWGNDYYILTNRRVVWLEKVLAIYNSRTESPLTSITASDVFRTYFGRIFDYGDIHVRTYMGLLSMKWAYRPQVFADFVQSYKTRMLRLSKEQQKQQIKEVVRERFETTNQPIGTQPVGIQLTGSQPAGTQPTRSGTPPLVSKPPQAPKKSRSFGKAIRTGFSLRYEENGTITYRRHWYSLIAKLFWPGLVLFGVASGFLLSGIFAPLFCLGGSAITTVLLGIILYRYVDWRNDIFILTNTQIIDIDKKPLGAESKKTANLDAPDIRIEHDRPNLIANILNYGNVTVFIGPTPFNMDGVYNPDQVHLDIAGKREELIQSRRKQDDERDQEQMLNWLEAYQEEQEKAQKRKP